MDKLLHFLVGFFICTVASALMPLWIGFMISIVAGIGKEVYDLKIKKTFYSWPDMVFTIIGGLIALFVLKIKYMF